MRVLFWGTSAFAAPSLRALVGEDFEVVGVVTQPDRPTGRSRSSVTASPIKEIALEEGMELLQPQRPRGEEFIAGVRRLEPEISVVVSYGQLLPEGVIGLPTLGTLNVHASLLPKLRGASPIRAAILEGLPETGITIMRLVPALDAGPVLLQMATPILDDESYGELELRLSELGALALIEALTLVQLGRQSERPQQDADASYAPKIDRAMARVDWTLPAEQVSRRIRAYDPKPGAFTTLRSTDVKLFRASEAEGERHDHPAPGEVLAVDGSGLTVACGSGAVRVAFVQPAGRRRLSAEDWHRGRGVALRDRFGDD
ncbi:MAG: methionyl-tRNA formyltransferase [Gemmatimonadota bacterium]|nr:methionyl-tRNA formyltransferase [Gemmatimonadota bacterium]